MFKSIISGFVRHLMTAGGGSITAVLLENGATTEDAEVIVAGLITLLGFIWSMISKYLDKKSVEKQMIAFQIQQNERKKYENLNS